MNYFKKIEVDLSEIRKFDKLQLKETHRLGGYNYHNSFFAGYDFSKKNEILDVLFKKIKFYIEPTTIDIIKQYGTNLGYHTDSNLPSVSLNYYLKTNGERTIFLKKRKQGIRIGYSLDNGVQNNSHVSIEYNNILNAFDDYACDFIAKDDDVYLLNTNEVHGVIRKSKQDVRLMLRCFWNNYTFEEILDSLTVIL